MVEFSTEASIYKVCGLGLVRLKHDFVTVDDFRNLVHGILATVACYKHSIVMDEHLGQREADCL